MARQKTFWFREEQPEWDRGLAQEIAVFGTEENLITLSLASLETIMRKAGYALVRTVE